MKLSFTCRGNKRLFSSLKESENRHDLVFKLQKGRYYIEGEDNVSNYLVSNFSSKNYFFWLYNLLQCIYIYISVYVRARVLAPKLKIWSDLVIKLDLS